MITHYAWLNPKLQVRVHRHGAGRGVYAREFVACGERLAVWGGAVVTLEQLQQLPLSLQQHSVQVEANLYLASPIEDEPADYVNHSCDPNAGMRGQITLVARRDIRPGEEVCFDYAMSDSTPYDEFDCHCGSALCRGRVRGDDWQRPELQARYRGYFSPYLEERIAQLPAASG